MLKKHHYLAKKTENIFFALFLFLTAALFVPVILSAQTTENCTNGIDDDGDGLIDCFDTDCTCTGQCADFYYTTCNAECYYVPPCGQISMGIQWVGQAVTDTYSPLVAGDLDQDGIPEVVTYQCEGTNIYIMNGQTGQTKATINSPTTLAGGTAPAIADLDNDGFGEIIIVGDDRYLRCYEHTGALKYSSAVQVGYNQRYRFSVPNIADFDHNGFAEINIGNQVFNGQTGALLASGGSSLSAGEHPKRRSAGFSFNMPVAIDALPDSFCPDCDGLEIVAGNQVMSVNLSTGNVTVVRQTPAAYSDGFTSVADFDRDGDLDAIVQGQKNNINTVYCWDIQTGVVSREFELSNNWVEGASRVNVADLNGDGQLEISFVAYPWLYALKNDFSLLWRNATNDVSSVTCSSVFDFCGDGSADVVYRGQSKLQILNGATGQISWEDDCVSATHIENPLILDVDADGQTEVIIQCGGYFTGQGTVLCYEAVGTPGISSRPVWNQHAYMSTNINDDLSVPRYQQNPHIVGDSLKMNTFLNQFFNPTFPSPDGILSFESLDCQGDSMAITIKIKNKGDNIIPALMPVSLYRGNPLAAPAIWVGTAPIGTIVQLGDSLVTEIKVPRNFVVNDTIYVVLNDNHSVGTPYNIADFPVTTYGECAFDNNFAHFYYAYNPDEVHLGNDTLICDNSTLPLSADGQDLVSWLWQDGSTLSNYTITDSGIFYVGATDICGIVHSDTLEIGIDSSTVLTLGPDLTICQGETVSLGQTGFDYYDWHSGPDYDCNSCPFVTASLPSTGNIILEAGLNNGCFSRDTVHLMVNDTFFVVIDSLVCKGDAVLMQGSTVLPGTSMYFYLNSIHGCDSTVLLNVIAKDTFATSETAVICPENTYNVFGVELSATGVYSKLFTAINGCDSTHTVFLTVQPLMSVALQADSSCLNEPTGAVQALVDGGALPYSYQWSGPVSDSSPDLDDVPPGVYRLTVTDANLCTLTAAIEVNGYPPIVYAAQADSVRCYGEANGRILVSSDDESLVFGLNGEDFGQVKVFEGLDVGAYSLYVMDGYGCSDTTQWSIAQPAELLMELPADTAVFLGDSVLLSIQATAPDIVRYSWNDTRFLRDTVSGTTYSQPLHSVRYSLTVTDARGCTASDQMTILIERIRQVFVPNVFSSAATDDINTQLTPGFGASVQKIRQFTVFDRWGTAQHSATDVVPGDQRLVWDGRLRGKTAPPGVYIWMMEVELIDGATEVYKGDVTLLR